MPPLSKPAQKIINKRQAEEKARKDKQDPNAPINKRLGVPLNEITPSRPKEDKPEILPETTTPPPPTPKETPEKLPEEKPTPELKNKSELGATPEQLEQVERLHKHFGLGNGISSKLANKSSEHFKAYIDHLKKRVGTHNTLGLKKLEESGITKYHLLEKGIKKFKVEPDAEKSRIEGNTLILGQDHFNKKEGIEELHNLINQNKGKWDWDTKKYPHLSDEAISKSLIMQQEADRLKRQGEHYQSHLDAAKRWSNLSLILRHAPQQGLKIIEHLNKAQAANESPRKSILDKLLAFKLKKGLQ